MNMNVKKLENQKMNRTLKSLLGAAVLVAFVAPVAVAQTGSLQGQRTIFNDGGTTVGTFNRIYLETPADATLVQDYRLILPPNDGNANDILFTPDGTGTLEFNSGDGLFWKLIGNNTAFVDGTNNLLGTLTADPLNIITNNTTRIRVLSNGNVGIGTTTPGFLLDVAGNTNIQGQTFLRKEAFYYDPTNGYAAGTITGVEPGGTSGDATKLGIYGGRNTGGIILYTNVNNSQTEVMRLTSNPNPAIGGRISIKAGTAPNALVAIGGGAGGNLTIDDNGNLVTAGNITINGTGTNTIGVAATTNNITGTNTVLGLTNINRTGSFNTFIGNAAGGNISLDVDSLTTDLYLNGITSNAAINDVLWITSDNEVRRTSFGGLVEQGITFDNELGVSRIRLGGLSTISNPFADDRYVNLDVYDLRFTGANGTQTMLRLDGDAANSSFVLSSFGMGEGVITSQRKTFIRNSGTGLSALFVMNTNATQDSWLEIGDQTGTGHMAIGINNPGGANFINSSTSRNLEIRTGNIVEATFSSTGLNIVNNLTVGDNATLGDADTDQHLIRGVTNINTTATGAATTIGATSNLGAVSIASGTTVTSNSTGLTSITGGTGVDVTATTGDVDVAATANAVNVNAGTTFNATGATGATVTATANNVTLNAGANVDINATANVTVDGVNVENTATNSFRVVAPTANINTSSAAASTTNIGNNTNGVTNIFGAGASGLTLTGNIVGGPAGTNTIVIDPGEASAAAGDEYDLILNNIKDENPIQDLLWITAGNEVRRTNFVGTANEGLQFLSSAYRLGANAIDVNPIVSSRIVTVGAGGGTGELSFQTAGGANNMLLLHHGGGVSISSVGSATTTIGSANAGTITLRAEGAGSDVVVTANDVVSLSSATISGTATGTMDLNMADLDVDATGTITQTSAGNSIYETTGGTLRIRTTGAAPGSNDILITSNDEILSSAGVRNTVESNTANGEVWLTATGASGKIRMVGSSEVRQWSQNLNLNYDYASASTTRIGNNTNAVVNVRGFGNNGVTITGGENTVGDNTIVIDPGTTTSDLVLNNIATSSAPVNMLSIDGSNQVRQKTLTSMADEGIQYDGTDGEFKLGHLTAGTGNPITTSRFVNVGAGGTLTFRDATNTKQLVLNNNGNVEINSSSTGTTTIGSSTAGAISATANANISLEAVGTGDITFTATGDAVNTAAANISLQGSSTVDMDAPAITINDASTGTTQIGNATAGTILVQSASTITETAGTTMDLNMADLDVDASATIDLNAGTTFTARGATAATMTATANALTLNANGTSGSVVVNATGAGNDVDINANDLVTIDATTITNTATTINNTATTFNVASTTANINTSLSSTTNIGSNVNGVVNLRGRGNNGVTITGLQNSNGDNTIVIDPGATTSDLVLNNIATSTAPVNMLSVDGSSQVRQKALTSMADEGLQYDGTDGEFKLGHTTTGTGAPITSSRFVNVGAGGTLTFRDATNTKQLVLNNNGNVEVNSSSTGTTTIGSSTAGAISATANANISLEAVGTGDITFTATGDAVNTAAANISLQGSATVDMDAPAITINDTGSGTTQIGNASAGNISINAGGAGRGLAMAADDAVTVNGTTLTTTTTGNTQLNATGAGSDVEINAAGVGGSVIVNASGVGNDLDINVNDLVTIDATTITNTATTFNVASTTANINTTLSSTTNIGNTTNGAVNIRGRGNNGVTITGAQTTAGDNTIVIDPGATTSNLVLNNISTLSPVLDLLWITTNNEVRRAPFTATADEGVQFQSSSYRLGVAASTDATPWNDKSFLEDRYVNLNTSSLFFTTNNSNSALLELNGDAANGSVNMFSYGTGNITLQAGSNDVVINANSATGMVQLNATNAAGDIDINAGDQLTIDGADVLVTASDVLTLFGNTASISTGTGDITVSLPASGDLVLNGVDTDNTVLTYLGVTGSNEVREVSLNETAWLLGGNTLTGTQTIGSNSAHDVGIETSGVTRLTFTAAGAITQGASAGQVTFTGNVDATNGLDVTNADLTVGGSNFVVDDATGNITNIGTTTFGDGTGVDNSLFNLGTTGLLTINNDPAIQNLTIQETAITRTGNIAINTGGNTINTDGSINATNNLTVNGTAALGDGSGTDNVTVSTGSGSFTVTGNTFINTSGTNSTQIGSQSSGAGIVDIEAQGTINLTTGGTGTVYIQGSNNGDVVIGNSTSTTVDVIGTVNINTTNSGGATNIGTGTNASNVTLGNTGNDVIMGAPATFQRSMNVKFNTINATSTLDESYHVVVCTNAGSITVNLPAAATAGAGRVYVIKSAGAGDVVIDPNGVETIEGLGTFTITGGGNLTRTIVSSGATWYVIGN